MGGNLIRVLVIFNVAENVMPSSQYVICAECYGNI